MSCWQTHLHMLDVQQFGWGRLNHSLTQTGTWRLHNRHVKERTATIHHGKESGHGSNHTVHYFIICDILHFLQLGSYNIRDSTTTSSIATQPSLPLLSSAYQLFPANDQQPASNKQRCASTASAAGTAVHLSILLSIYESY